MAKGFKKQPEVKLEFSDYGKVPPQAKDLEEAVLGACMLEKYAFEQVNDILSKDDFYLEIHKDVWEVFTILSIKNTAIDMLTVVSELRAIGKLNEQLSPYYITQLASKVASAAHIEFHARIIRQKSIGRNLISIGGEMVRDGYDETKDVFELAEESQRKIESVFSETQRATKSISDLSAESISELKKAFESPDEILGVPSGIRELDKKTGGWQKGNLIIVAARPGMGKTAFVGQIALNACLEKRPVAFFSLEMSGKELVQRSVSNITGIYFDILRKGDYDHNRLEDVQKASAKIASLPLFIDDTPAITLSQLRRKAKKYKRENGIELLVIDYLQLMSGDDKTGNREQEISKISRGLKALAKELEIPVIALSQLSRSVETRGGQKVPMLSDLRESGAIEQDADVVIFLWRGDYYDITTYEEEGDAKGVMHKIIAKNRNGSLEAIRSECNIGAMRVWSLGEEYHINYYTPPKQESNKTIFNRGLVRNPSEPNDNPPF